MIALLSYWQGNDKHQMELKPPLMAQLTERYNTMENVEQIYRYRESLLDKKCPKHLNTRELRNAWYESIKKEYQLLTQKIERLESEI